MSTVKSYGRFPSTNPGRSGERYIEVRLLWDSLSPEVVRVGLLADDAEKPVPWVLEREMLAAGINRTVNPGGDIRVRPALGGKQVIVTFGNVDLGMISVHLRTGFIAEFIERTVRHAPLGASSSIESAPWWAQLTGGVL